MIPKPQVTWSLAEVLVADLPTSSSYKIRESDFDQVLRYELAMEEGAVFPPIKVANVRGRMHVVDGYHRLAASRRLGRETIAAEVGKMKASTARAWAIDANAANSLPLRPSDRRPIFNMYCNGKLHLNSDGKRKSYRDISAELASALGTALSPNTVKSWMLDWEQLGFKYDPDMPSAQFAHPDDAPWADTEILDEVDANLAHIRKLYVKTKDTQTATEIRERIEQMLLTINYDWEATLDI